MEEPREFGNWKKISNLGSGGFGVVCLWENNVTKEKIAIKKCRWYMPDQIPPNQRRRWTQEVEMLRTQIRHENIASYKPIPDDLHPTLEKFNHSKLPLLPMEYCTRGNLRHYLNKQEHVCGLPEMEVRHVLKDLSAAIAYLHDLNITHRDIKPENVVLQRCDGRPKGVVYKLIDLGYAKELGSQVASFVGTLPYLAPEIFKKSSYGRNVDYWSFGILAFEVVCGIHPFLPKLDPVQRFEHLQKKTANQICLYTSRNGEIIYSEEILPENHINPILKIHLENWLKSMLRYVPSQRGILPSNKDVFEALNDILDKQILRVFSVYNYRCLYYEIGEGETLAGIQTLLERDCGIPVGEQLLITGTAFDADANADGDRIVLDCLDETDLFTSHWTLLRKSHFVKTPEHTLPPIVKNLMANPNKEYTWSSLYVQIAKSVHYIHKETALMASLQKSNCHLFHFVKNQLRKEAAIFERVKVQTGRILVQIEVYKEINMEMKQFVVKNGFGEDYKKYKQLLWQSRELVENFNAVMGRHFKVQDKEGVLNEIGVNLENIADQNAPENIYKEAVTCMTISNHATTFSAKNIVKVLSTCFQKRFKMTMDPFYIDYVNFASKVLREIERLTRWMNALDAQMEKVFAELTAVQTEILKHFVENGGKVPSARGMNLDEDMNAEDLIEDNKRLRYDVQSVMSQLLLAHKTHSLTIEGDLETQV